MSLQDGLLFAVAPAAVGYAVALALLLMARREVTFPPERQGQAMVFMAIPMTAVIIALVAALNAATASDVMPQLLAMGAAGFVCAAAQGFLGARAMRTVAAQPEMLGRALIPVAAVEVLPILALLWIMTSVAPTAI